MQRRRSIALRFLAKFWALADKISAILFAVGCFVLAFVWLLIDSQIVTRYFLGISYGWVMEVVAYSMLFITFLSAAWVHKGGGHVSMDLLLVMVKPRVRVLLNAISSIISTILWLVVTWYSGQLTWALFKSGEHYAVGSLEPLKAGIVVIIPVGSFFLFIQCLGMTYGLLRNLRVSRDRE